jgi:hypothetical protein
MRLQIILDYDKIIKLISPNQLLNFVNYIPLHQQQSSLKSGCYIKYLYFRGNDYGWVCMNGGIITKIIYPDIIRFRSWSLGSQIDLNINDVVIFYKPPKIKKTEITQMEKFLGKLNKV